MDRKKILVAFGDVRGFRKWILRANNSPENASELMNAIYEDFEQYARASDGHIKFLGDGFMVVEELRNGHNCGTARSLLLGLRELTDRIVAKIGSAYPRPDGFRVRVASGHVWKRQTVEMVRGKFIHHPEYIGYAVNMAQSLLYVYPDKECICHESVVELIGPKRAGITLTHLQPPEERRHGIDQQDFAGLWSFERTVDLSKDQRGD